MRDEEAAKSSFECIIKMNEHQLLSSNEMHKGQNAFDGMSSTLNSA